MPTKANAAKISAMIGMKSSSKNKPSKKRLAEAIKHAK